VVALPVLSETAFLNLCRLVALNVWSFNLYLKRNSVTASLSLCLFASAIDFPLCLCLFGVLIYIKNKTA